jgi:hypothetical protein
VEEKKQNNAFSGFFDNVRRSYEEGSKPINFFGLRNDMVDEPKKIEGIKEVSNKRNYLDKSIAEMKIEKIKRILLE